MSSTTHATLIRMANQIARELARENDPAGATANHIRLYWEPRMIAAIRVSGTEGLSQIAAQAFARLEQA